jgi:hypothetical protein
MKHEINRLKNKAVLLFLITNIILASCNTTEPPGSKGNAVLSLEDVSCTEAWLKLSTSGIQLPAAVTLTQDGKMRETVNIAAKDTILYVDSLLPNQTYKFKISSNENPPKGQEVSSNEVSATTLDTTSNNFTFTKYTFGGDAGSCVLRDVAIINDTCIYAVGEINIADTSQNGYTLYCYIKWDGKQWKLGRLKYFPPGSVGDSATSHGYSVFAFGENDVWISGDALFHWDGSHWSTFYNTGGEDANKMCGPDSSELYAVGNGGHIARYSNGQWSKIESGTSLDFHDIYGATDPKTGKQQILAVCSRNLPLGKAIYKIEGNTAVEISSAPIQWELAGVWFIPNRHYYVVGDGIYEKKFLTDSLWKNEPLDITHYVIPKIRGNGLNDVFAAGAFGETLHYNGMSWKSYIEDTRLNSGGYYSVCVKNNTIVLAGFNYQSSIITIGKRIN